MSEGERRLAAIMFTDIQGYSAIAHEDESLALRLLSESKKVLVSLFRDHNGVVIKSIGDGFLVEFGSAVDAVKCAVEIQNLMRERNERAEAGERVDLRIGIHLGDVVHQDGDLLGDGVNIAARVEPLSEAGGLCVSRQVYDQVYNKLGLKFVHLGERKLKNIASPVDVYKLALGTSGTEGEMNAHRLAVLPLANISPEPRDAYFADGMTEELITVLSQVRGLRVIARTSVDHYKEKEWRVSEIGKELGVGSVMEGSVRIAGNRLRVTVQLIDASSEEHVWSENYDRNLEDVFAIQSDIAKRVARTLKVKLLGREEDKLNRRAVTKVTVYSNYLKGRALLARRNPNEMGQAKDLFEKAIAEDPNYAQAYAGLSDTYYLLGDYWAMPVEEARQRSHEFLSLALKLNPDLPEARARLAMNLMAEYRFTEAESEFRHAIELNPSYAMSHMWYAMCLASKRLYEEQLEELEIAEQLDPLSTAVLSNEALALALLGRKASAWQKVLRVSELDPNSVSTIDITSYYYYLVGDPARALKEVEMHPEFHKEIPMMFDLAVYLVATGAKGRAFPWLNKLLAAPETTSAKAWAVALVYAELRDYDRFFVWANKAVDRRQVSFDNVELLPCLRGVVGDPRWKAILRRVNLDSP